MQDGDRNTRFFHIHASARKRSNGFQWLKGEDGEWHEKPEEVQDIITNYFTRLFQTTWGTGCFSEREEVNQVTDIQNEALLSEITLAEVKEAVFSMHPDKSPGPDGLNPSFFQSFWSIIGMDVFKFCQDFMNTGELPREVNQTTVCLIPKVKQPQSMTELRPISLCNVLVRILSKVLSNRLKPCLNLLISDKQSAFVEGRLLTDNALIAFEINHFMKRRKQGKSGVAGLNVDISKAYDRLEWSFIRNMMDKFGFHVTWVERVMKLVQTVSYNFVHNGNLFGDIVPSRGVRQGDPISPYIYILCVRKD